MERKELKKFLVDMKINEKLTEMPAIVEPLYEEFMEDTTAEMKKSKRIKVSKDGNFSFDDKNISLGEDGEAVIESENTKIIVNRFGIEESYFNEIYGKTLSITRENGKVKTLSSENEGEKWKETISLDNGSWCITNADGELLSTASSFRKNKKENLKLRVEEILSKFNIITSTIMNNYSITTPWYLATKADIRAYIDEEKIRSLEKDVEKLNLKNKELEEENKKMTGMLGKSLEFMKEVKKNPIAKLFLRKGIQKYEADSKSLNSGIEE